MKEPSLYEKIHWRIFNVFGRAFGVGLSVVSLVFIIEISMELAGKSNWSGLSKSENVFAIFFFVFLFGLGVTFLRAKPFYPKEYSEYFSKNTIKTTRYNKSIKQTGGNAGAIYLFQWPGLLITAVMVLKCIKYLKLTFSQSTYNEPYITDNWWVFCNIWCY